MVESTVNNCHYESVTTNVRMPLYREIQRLCFYVWFVRQITDSNGCTFAYWAWLFKKFYADQWDQAKATKSSFRLFVKVSKCYNFH